ncbi:YvrJ family protein [Rossellomorea vietnamensis]|jgi:large-conductance mechanosensitive channel|uniref:YvrJ family protein n=1 Tax=Rossellomorea vietnamensis TaxID=218284 RepID=A0A6I6UTY5_9BACI|nr:MULTISPECIES: YvrJ family protein [Rossellomorea]MCC5803401.1 YvrJ family protein [Rossellomorea vietnamensis]QHE63499.1 YvrJ family protein [Rossellomorea vietnamensis]UTE77643.1 YvrJ family protein [Rossellomorea sp. KS-H15a]
MDYSVFVQLLGNFGFPIAVTLFLLVKLEKKLEQLELAIHTLSKSFHKKDQ